MLITQGNVSQSLLRPECQAQIDGFKGPIFRKFSTEEEALQFLEGEIIYLFIGAARD